MAVVHGVPVVVPPPQGYVVDFDHPKRNADLSSYIVSGVGIFISTLMMLQRLYIKGVIRKTFRYDDVLLIIAWIGAIVIQALIIYSFHTRIMGIHAFEIPLDTFKRFLYVGGFLTSIVYTVPTTLAKVVILLFYKELNNLSRWYTWSVNVMLFVVIAGGISILFSSIFACAPIAKAYDLSLVDVGSCIDITAMYQATAGIGVATDFLIAALPIPMVMGLQMTRSRKAGIIVTFLFGSTTVITSIVRLVLLVNSLGSTDETWGGGPICLWICIEANLLICCASLATIRQFFRLAAPRIKTITGTSATKEQRKPPLNHELHTIGSSSAGGVAYYNRFDASNSCIDTVTTIQSKRPRDPEASEDWDSVDNYEVDSADKGIVQTKTTNVHYNYI